MNPPTPAPAPLLDDFRAGLTACLRSWSAFRAGVEGGWGGTDSFAKADYLRSSILQHFDGSPNSPRTLTVDDLEDNLAIYLEEEFSVVLEDMSERQVAHTIWHMYEQCMRGDATLARQLVQAACSVLQQATSYPVQVQSQPEDDDDDDEEMMDTNDETVMGGVPAEATPPTVATAAAQIAVGMTSARDYAAQSLFGPPTLPPVVDDRPVRQLGETAPAPPPVVAADEDGFAPVVKRKGRKN
jgi:pre-rRNA-processing protein TSR2